MLLNVNEAKSAILQQVKTLTPIKLALIDALGHVLAGDIYATLDIPAFKQSSMDGYAVRYEDRMDALSVVGEMAAGTSSVMGISNGETARIFTGAPVPEGADTVVMQEKVTVESGRITIQDPLLKHGSNTREKGSEVKSGALAIQQGTYLTPAALGFLAGIGETDVLVYPMPKVGIILTGKELQSPGQPLSAGQVYESNSFSLRGALAKAGVDETAVYFADDDLRTLTDIMAEAILANDLVVLTGGVSVGDYDFVVEAAMHCGVEKIFHKVKQKPGKPLYFGTLGNKLIFGLPGNPSSVLNCFYQFVLPAVEAVSGRAANERLVEAILETPYEKTAGLTHFVKAIYSNGHVKPLGAQESFRMSSFANANCMIRLEEDRTSCSAGEKVTVYLLPE
jgi:molybdopterin molybdotransferase